MASTIALAAAAAENENDYRRSGQPVGRAAPFVHDHAMDEQRLTGVALFSSLSKPELKRLAQWTDEIDVAEGQELATEGSFAHEFFVIESGTAEVTQNGDRIAELGPGDFFGEIGLLETVRRTATVAATSPMRLIVMFQREFRQMEQEMPGVADRVRAAIRARLSE
jgi:CRP-like cAMP-binding protein